MVLNSAEYIRESPLAKDCPPLFKNSPVRKSQRRELLTLRFCQSDAAVFLLDRTHHGILVKRLIWNLSLNPFDDLECGDAIVSRYQRPPEGIQWVYLRDVRFSLNHASHDTDHAIRCKQKSFTLFAQCGYTNCHDMPPTSGRKPPRGGLNIRSANL